jgi:hypothetical protein
MDRAATERLVGIIVDGPTPADDGNVTFRVQVGDEVLVGIANPCGGGCREPITDPNLAVSSATMRVVHQFIEEHGAEMLPLYREAARMRRAAGNAPIAGNTRRGLWQLVASPKKLDGAVVLFVTKAGARTIKVILFREGGFVDDCDDWEAVTDEDRDEAFTVCLDHVLDLADGGAELALDAALLDELWR